MPSSLRYSTTSSQPITTIQRLATPSPPLKKQKMSLTQTYILATVARRQLQKEAARADHDLRLLVGHANLLDGLMLDLAHAEEEQESWFNQSVSSAESTAAPEPKRVQWADQHSIPEEAIEEDMYEDDSDDSDSDDEEEIAVAQRAVRKTQQQPQPIVTSMAISEDEDEDQEMDDDFEESLTLTRTHSRSPTSSISSPPDLMHEDSDDSEESDDDVAMPPSPPTVSQAEFPLSATFTEKERQAIVTTSIYQSKSEQPFFEENGFAIAAY